MKINLTRNTEEARRRVLNYKQARAMMQKPLVWEALMIAKSRAAQAIREAKEKQNG